MKTAMMLGLLAVSVQTQAQGTDNEVYPINLSGYAHGQVLNGADLNTAIATVENFHSEMGLLVAYDTSAGLDIGTVLMIQDAGPGFAGFTDSGQTVVRQPSAETRDTGGTQPGAGAITLNFPSPIEAIGFTLTGVQATPALQDGSSYAIHFSGNGKTVKVAFADFTDPASPFYDEDVAFGEGSVNPIDRIRVDQLGLTEINRVVIHLGGPGGVGGMTFEILDGGWDPGGPGDFLTNVSGTGRSPNLSYPQNPHLPGVFNNSGPSIRSGVDTPNSPQPEPPGTPTPTPTPPLPPGGGGGSVVPTPSAALAAIAAIGGMIVFQRRR